MNEITVIDSHQHVFWHGRDDAGLIADMDAQGIRLAWLLTWEIPAATAGKSSPYVKILNPARIRDDGSHPGIVLDDLLSAHRRYPGRFVLGYCPDPAQPAAADLFESACEMHGVRVCGEWKFQMLLDDPRSIQLFRAAGRRRAPVVLHLDVPWRPYAGGTYDPKWYGGTVDHLVRAMELCPETIFIGHAPGFWRELSGDASKSPDEYPGGPLVGGGRIPLLLERYPNLYADLSAHSAIAALQRDPAFSREFLIRFSDRLLFARDYYGGALKEFLDALELPASARRKILGGNAAALLDPGPA